MQAHFCPYTQPRPIGWCDMLLTMICMIPEVNVGVGEMGFKFSDFCVF